jgi:hypothetical protein
VTLVNGKSVRQIYDRLDAKTGEYNATGVTVKVQYKDANGQWRDLEQGYEFPAGATLECKVTMTCTQDETKNMMHEFILVTDPDELTNNVSKQVTDRFSQILNNELDEITYSYETTNWLGRPQTVTEKVEKGQTYNALYSNMYSWKIGYTGNVDGAQAADIALVNSLFGGELNLEIDGKPWPVSVMIKKEDVYDTSSEEMVLYMTADLLNSATNVNPYPYPPVYVAVFTQVTNTDANGNTVTRWEQVGPILAGQAKQTNYYGFDGTGSFDTRTWVSTEVYEKAAVGSTLTQVVDQYE